MDHQRSHSKASRKPWPLLIKVSLIISSYVILMFLCTLKGDNIVVNNFQAQDDFPGVEIDRKALVNTTMEVVELLVARGQDGRPVLKGNCQTFFIITHFSAHRTQRIGELPKKTTSGTN
jgi:hypothetical protein